MIKIETPVEINDDGTVNRQLFPINVKEGMIQTVTKLEHVYELRSKSFTIHALELPQELKQCLKDE